MDTKNPNKDNLSWKFLNHGSKSKDEGEDDVMGGWNMCPFSNTPSMAFSPGLEMESDRCWWVSFCWKIEDEWSFASGLKSGSDCRSEKIIDFSL